MILKINYCIGIVMALFWVIMYVKNFREYDRRIEKAPENMYASTGCLIIGYSLIDRFHIIFDKAKYSTLVKKISGLYGSVYAEYYLNVIKAAEIGIMYDSIMLACLISVITERWELGLLIIIIGSLLVWNNEREVEEQLTYKKTKMQSDLPVVISKLTLLVGAGMTLRNAWDKTAYEGEGPIYDEMRMVAEDKRNGVTDERAFGKMAERCEDKNLKRFVVAMTQNLQKGSAEQMTFLRDMSAQMWDAKKKLILKKLEDTKSLLLLPLFLIFIGILIMIIVPMLGSVTSFF